MKNIFSKSNIENATTVSAPWDLHESIAGDGQPVNTFGPPKSGDFITDMITCPIATVDPQDGVRQGFAGQYFSHEGALAKMAVPANCPVPVAVTIEDRERKDLGSYARGFFAGVMRPTIKHI